MRLKGVREDLRTMFPGRILCNQTWGEWKDAAGVKHYAHTCSQEEWIRLCACCALRRMRKKVTKLSVDVFLRTNGHDPFSFLPGILPLSNAKDLSGTFLGREIPDVIQQKTSYRPSENTVKAWVKAIGAGRYTRSSCFSASDVEKLIRHYVQIRVEASSRARDVAQVNSPFKRKTA